ncbi:MAG: hypothetical protein J6R98_04450, partial [Bacteroidaceae bacterium]|nr:hypothetical protein [Bacteroidaceae bacterium]
EDKTGVRFCSILRKIVGVEVKSVVRNGENRYKIGRKRKNLYRKRFFFAFSLQKSSEKTTSFCDAAP